MQEFFNGLLASYAQFFSVASFMDAVGSTQGILTVLNLIFLEGVLSADNAIVLAIMVKHLPDSQRKKALTYGIIGAYVFRFIAIGMGNFIVKWTAVKVVGGVYLLYLAYKHFFKNEEDAHQNRGYGFWGTVAVVEGMDIVFSVDSILAAFGVSDKVWIMFLGGLLGILAMRFAASIFTKLIEKVPDLEHAAYILITLIGSKLLMTAGGIHLPESFFIAAMVLVFGGTFAKQYLKREATA